MRLRQLKSVFKNIGLKWKLLSLYSVLFIVPLILISITVYVEVSESISEKIRYSALQSYEQSKSYLEYKISAMIQRTDVVVTSNYLSSLIAEARDSEDNLPDRLGRTEEIRSYLQSVEGNTAGIRFRIYLPNEHNFVEDGSYVFSMEEAERGVWYQKKGEHQIYFVPGGDLEDEYQQKFFSLVRDIPDQHNYRISNGILRMDIEKSELEELLLNAAPTEHAVSYLINETNQMIMISDQEALEDLEWDGEIPSEFLYSKYAGETEFYMGRIGGQSVYYLKNKIRNTDWEMITVIPKKDMVSGIAKIQYIVAGLMMVFGVLTIMGGAIIVSWIVRRLSYLINGLRQVQQGNMEVYLETDSKDEIGVIYDSYNEMIVRIKNLMDEKFRMGVSLKNAELKALQAQINPHFLYNTLDLINWMAFEGKTDEIHKAVISLSKFYRLTLNKGKDTLTLEEEMKHVGYFMQIQDMRFPGKVIYEEEVDCDCKNCIVPKIILQPLAENAIKHGIWEKEEKSGYIRISAKRQRKPIEDGNTEKQPPEDIVMIKIEDDGIGMDAYHLKHVLDGSLNGSGSSYGVKNIKERIWMMFGTEYGLTYESREGEGTAVTIRIPYQE